MKILVVVGTRPEFIKMAPIIAKMQQDSSINLVLANAGQHYDFFLTQKIFEDLQMIKPKYELCIGSNTHAQQTSSALVLIENVIRNERPDVVISEGDTNMILAASLASVKMHVPHAHVEAGLRSFDRYMPEEINRICADHTSGLLFAPTEIAEQNLLKENISKDKIFVTGNTIVDAVYSVSGKIDASPILEKMSLRSKNYVLVTFHRSENTDSKENMLKFLEVLSKVDCKVVFPIHPRTKDSLYKFDLWDKMVSSETLKVADPTSYIDTLKLIKHARCVLTDSGGIQEETCILNTPCLTLRDNTERPESVFVGNNKIIGLNPNLINLKGLTSPGINPFGDGRASERIIRIIKEKYEKGELKI